MGDLISRSQLLKEIESWGGCVEAMHEYISNMPTAYDVEKVVAELEEEREKAEKEMEECIFKALPYHDSTEGTVIGIKKAIDIVKRGGVE